MKKILLLVAICAVGLYTAGCSKSEDQPNLSQDYTSFVFVNKTENAAITLPNCVVGYYANDIWYRVASLGDIKPGESSAEIRVDNPQITQIYFFMDYPNDGQRLDDPFILIKNIKNIFELNGQGGQPSDNTDPTQYPLTSLSEL